MNDQTKTICFLVPTLKGGGAEKNIINIINSLDPNALSVTLIVSGGEDNYSHLLPEGVSVIKLNCKDVKNSVLPIIKIIKRLNPDIIFSSAPHLSLPITLFTKIFKTNILNILRMPTLPSNSLAVSAKERLIYNLNKFIYSLADIVVVQTKQMEKEAIELMGLNKTKIKVIHNIINKDQVISLASEQFTSFDFKNFNIVAAGTLYEAKGFDILIRAIEHLKDNISNLKVHILGDEKAKSGYRSKLDNLIRKLGLENYVVFHGFRSNPYPYLKAADVFVLSSRSEGFPNVVLEALTLRTPVVATNCIDFTGIIYEGVNGHICNVEDHIGLSSAIISTKTIQNFPSREYGFDFTSWFLDIRK